MVTWPTRSEEERTGSKAGFNRLVGSVQPVYVCSQPELHGRGRAAPGIGSRAVLHLQAMPWGKVNHEPRRKVALVADLDQGQLCLSY